MFPLNLTHVHTQPFIAYKLLRQNAICILKLQLTATPHTKRFFLPLRENSAFALSHRVRAYLSSLYVQMHIVIRKKRTIYIQGP